MKRSKQQLPDLFNMSEVVQDVSAATAMLQKALEQKPLTEQEQARVASLLEGRRITLAGFGGFTRHHVKVDRRLQPDATPIAPFEPLGIPSPRCIKCEAEKLIEQLLLSVCEACRNS